MLPERRTIGDLLAHLAQATPQHESVVLPPRRLTYVGLHAQATAVAGGLWCLGIRPGEPVALLLSNRPEWITVALGCALIGTPVVAISTWSRRVELEYVLDHSQAVALVTLDGFLGADYQALLTEITPEVAQHPPGRLSTARLPALRVVYLQRTDNCRPGYRGDISPFHHPGRATRWHTTGFTILFCCSACCGSACSYIGCG